MKGISAVIATILMLMITIAMVGLAYMYISGIFISSTAQSIVLSSADCVGGDIHVAVRNAGTENIPENGITTIVDDATSYTCGSLVTNVMQPGNTTLCAAISADAGAHSIRVIGPSNSLTGTVICIS